MKRIINKVICALFVAFILLSCAHKSGHKRERSNGRCQPVATQQAERASSNRTERKIGSNTKVNMRKDGGVYYIPIIVNGLNLDFVFDTGASNISLSAAEATVMARQGKITEDDIVGEAQFSDANGGISVGTVVLLRTVQIGGITLHNVEASVVDNIQAPLLLGQSALAKFGKVTIDYNKNTIEFN